MFSFAQSKQKRWVSSAWHGSVPLSRSRKKSPPTSPAAASSAALVMRPLDGAVLVRLRLRRGEELGDDLDREDTGNPTPVVDHGGVLGLVLEEVGEGVPHHVVELEDGAEGRVGPGGDDVGAEVALAEPAERAALAVDQQW